MLIRVSAALRVTVVLFAWATASVQAGPLLFTTAQFDTTAVASSSSAADFNSDSSASSPLPLISNALVLGSSEIATGGAIAAPGLLTTLAEADLFSSLGLASAIAQSHFVGTFSGTGSLTLNLGFTSDNVSIGGAFGSGTVFVLLTNTLGSTTTTLFNDLFTVGDDITLAFALSGGLNTLDLTLVSEADALVPGQWQNTAALTFAGTIDTTAIPEPGTLALAGLALLGLAASRRRTAG